MARTEWFAFCAWGAGSVPTPRVVTSVAEADSAASRWRDSCASKRGAPAAADVRLLGPFATRREAREADISGSGGPVVKTI